MKWNTKFMPVASKNWNSVVSEKNKKNQESDIKYKSNTKAIIIVKNGCNETTKSNKVKQFNYNIDSMGKIIFASCMMG